jgi:hypothetical protein
MSENRSQLLKLIDNYIAPENKANANVGLTPYSFNKGAICDDIGFSNHIGECWNSTLWEILLFSDDLKDFFQSRIYNLNTSDLEKNIISVFRHNNISEDNKIYIAAKLAKHLLLIKKRFIEHYNYLINRNRRNNATRKIALNSKRRHSMVCGIASAKYGINIFRGESNKYKSGLDRKSVKQFITYIIRVFTAPFKIEELTSSLKYKESDIKAIILTAHVYRTPDSEYQYTYSGKDHMLGFLKCNDKWKLYDGSFNLIPITYDIVKLFLNKKLCIYISNTGKLYIATYTIEHIKLDNNDTKRAIIPLEYYADDTWIPWDNSINAHYLLQIPLCYLILPRVTVRRSGGFRRTIRR